MKMNLKKIFEDYREHKITESYFIEALSTIVDNSHDLKLRRRILKFLGKSDLKSNKLFELLESLLISDEDEVLRNITVLILRNQFLEKSYKPMKFSIKHEESPLCLKTIYESLLEYIDHLPYSKSLDTRAFLLQEVMDIKIKEFKIGFERLLELETQDNISINELKAILINYYTYLYLKKVFWRIKIEINECRVTKVDFLFKSIKEVPEALKNLKDLEHLILRYNKLTILPEWIASFNSLRILNANVNNLIHIPKSLGELKELKELSLWKNQLKELPESLGNIKSLENLNLRLNYIKDIPQSIGNLYNLLELNLHDNKLQFLPKSIGTCRSLKKLNLSWNSLKNLPDEIGSLETLEILDLAKNNLVQIPKTIKNLKNLKVLNISENELTNFPKEISFLPSLEYFNISRNKLTHIPKSVINLESLKEFYIGENEFDELDGTIKSLRKRGVQVYI